MNPYKNGRLWAAFLFLWGIFTKNILEFAKEKHKGQKRIGELMNPIYNGEKVEFSEAQIDTINMLVGLLNASGIRKYIRNWEFLLPDNQRQIFLY